MLLINNLSMRYAFSKFLTRPAAIGKREVLQEIVAQLQVGDRKTRFTLHAGNFFPFLLPQHSITSFSSVMKEAKLVVSLIYRK